MFVCHVKLEDAHKDVVTRLSLRKVNVFWRLPSSKPHIRCHYGTEGLKESMERLQVDYIDIFQCHDIEFRNLDQVKQPLSIP